MSDEEAKTSKVPRLENPGQSSGSTSENFKGKIIVSGNKSSSILVNPRQKGNPLLKNICHVPWEYDDSIVPDYVMGRTACALFLSLRYHNLKPDYINERLKALGKLYDLRVLLVQIDMKDPHHSLKHITRVCLLTDLTLMLAWSPKEAGKILEMYKIFEFKPPDLIMERSESDPYTKIVNSLTSVRSINKTDAATLLSNYGTLENIIKSSQHSLSQCPGLGSNKAHKLYSLLHTPFLKTDTKKSASGTIAKYFK